MSPPRRTKEVPPYQRSLVSAATGGISATDRLRYLYRNLLRNVAAGGDALASRPLRCRRNPDTPSSTSPNRAATEAFIRNRLPELLPPKSIRVPDIGCGSGRLSGRLALAGYSGSYIGIDSQNRFTEAVTKEDTFERRFFRGDVHFVSSGWALPLYLWHGYRQYPLKSLRERFDPERTEIYRLGGAASYLLHFIVITLGEMLLRPPLAEAVRQAIRPASRYGAVDRPRPALCPRRIRCLSGFATRGVGTER